MNDKKPLELAVTIEWADPSNKELGVVGRTTGTYAKPYVKEDGTSMAKWGFHAPTKFIEKFKRFSATLPLGQSGKDWAMKLISDEIDRLEGKGGRLG